MGDSLNLETVLKIIKKNIILIVALTIISGLLMAAVTYLMLTPKYEAETQVLVSQPAGGGSVNNQDIETSLQLIHTYRDIILSPIILEEVAGSLNLDQSIRELSEQISVSNQDQSQVVTITVVDDSIEGAIAIADGTADVFREQVTGIMNVDNVSILAPAHLEADPLPVAPDPVVNITVGIVAGLMIGLTLAFAQAFFDKSVRNEEDVSKHLGIPVVGSIDKFVN